MPAESFVWIIAALAMFGFFAVGVGYVNIIASARAITREEEQAARQPVKRAGTVKAEAEPLKLAA